MLARVLSQPSPRGARRARFEQLALCHLDALFGTALRLTHNERDAEDLVQDALLQGYQAFDSFTGEHCKAWLFKILTNSFITKYRRRVLERTVADAMERESHSPVVSQTALREARDPEGVLHARLLSDDVQQALAALPEDFRLAVLLCDVEEFSYKEIADIMECPVGTVMSRLHRGRRLLQEALREYAAREGIGVHKGAEGERGAAVIPLHQAQGRGRGGQSG